MNLLNFFTFNWCEAMAIMNPPLQTAKEEVANGITHGLGALLSTFGFGMLLYSSIMHGSVWHIVSCALYGGSLLILYYISTIYHALRPSAVKRVFRILDHISIYLLIAGTYMPLTLVVLQGPLAWTLFGLECGLCLTGILFKAIFGPKYPIASVVFYMLMGCLVLFAAHQLIATLSLGAFLLVALGGFFYVAGIPFYAMDRKMPFFHAIWHLFVLAGSLCHFFMIFYYVIPFAKG